jgi:hypothetical protein
MVVGAFIAWVTVAVIVRLILDEIRVDPTVCPYCATSIPQSGMEAASVASRPKSTDDRRH